MYIYNCILCSKTLNQYFLTFKLSAENTNTLFTGRLLANNLNKDVSNNNPPVVSNQEKKVPTPKLTQQSK